MLHLPLRLAAVACLAALAVPAAAQTSFVAFESGLVRPLAVTATRLFAVNTPDNSLEVFTLNANGITHASSIPVGLEPVAVAAQDGNTIWVVNHLSDSVSLVDALSGKVTRTLLVGDEPRDIVFAQGKAFITTAHRGQHRTHASLAGVPGAGDPQLTTPGVDRADVWVFDTTDLDQGAGPTLGGVPERIVTLFGDTPRALATDGTTVYAAVFHSGNQTAVVNEGTVCNGFAGAVPCPGDGITSPDGLAGGQLPGGNPGPSANQQGVAAPEVGLVVQFDEGSGEWRDEQGRNWSNGIRFHLPDLDVFEIDAGTLAVGSSHAHVGTILFNMVTHGGKVYVSNTDAQNLTRFEGPGVHGGTTVQGNLARSRITVIDGSAVKPRHLNPHIDYGVTPAPLGVKQHSLATPVQMAVDASGKLYVAAFGSSKIGVIDTAVLDDDAKWDGAGGDDFDPTTASAAYIPVSGGGPAGLALDEARGFLYVLTRFDNSISVVDLGTGTERNHVPLHNPEPPEVTVGRPMLYDAFKTSSNGEASCASCHVFGDFDSLAWDLGNPDDVVTDNPQPINLGAAAGDVNGGAATDEFHPMKGPMTTQTLRGMVNSGHMHWRGDRATGFLGSDDPHTNDSRLSFKNFIVAFEGLLGSELPPTDLGLQADMEDFADFALALTLPPNPVRALENTLNADEQEGRNFFFGNAASGSTSSDGIPIPNFGFTCDGCHTLDPTNGFFGTGGNASFENETQIVKVPHLRNLYQKVGMFGAPDNSFINAGDNAHKGDQVRGTGFLHDGSTDTLFRFFQATVFNPAFGSVGFQGGDPERRDVEAFMLAFDTDLAPIVGQQTTLGPASPAAAVARVGTLKARAAVAFDSQILGPGASECDLVVKGVVSGEKRGWVYRPVTGEYDGDRVGQTYTQAQLDGFALVAGQELTYTCVPPGSGDRIGIDRDQDGELDGDESDAGTDPGNPGSVLGACSDGIDNDGDGLVDAGGDPGCASLASNIENPACSDGYDNDNDGFADGADPQCTSPSRQTERKLGCGLLGVEPLLALALARRRRRSA